MEGIECPPPTEEMRKEALRTLELTGSLSSAEQMLSMMLTQGMLPPEVPVDTIDKIREAFMSESGELIEKMIIVYSKYYNLADLKAINAFYESPAGQRLLDAMPQVTAELMQAGKQWGERAMERVFSAMEGEEEEEGAVAVEDEAS